jgi:glycosyltransferase involved in cell wall biosynthesis
LLGRIELVIVGPDEDGWVIREPGVHYLGAQPREVVVGALARATCLATMSESESFGIVLLEAWLAGTPVVANARCASFAELVKNGTNGMLVRDERELADAISAYASDKALATAHAAAGRELAGGFDWSVLADSLSRVLQNASVSRQH